MYAPGYTGDFFDTTEFFQMQFTVLHYALFFPGMKELHGKFVLNFSYEKTADCVAICPGPPCAGN